MWLTWTILGSCVLLMALAFALPSLNNLNQSWMQCEVIRAYAQRGDNNSVYPWRVNLETPDCGVVSYHPSLQREEVERVAASFEPGRYEFKMGMIAKLAAKGYIPNTNATAEDYRRAE